MIPRTLVPILSTNSPSSNHSNSLLLRSSRPGRPPKRATVGLSIAATHLAQQHHHQLKKHRLDNGDYPGYENGHLGGKYSGSLSHSMAWWKFGDGLNHVRFRQTHLSTTVFPKQDSQEAMVQREIVEWIKIFKYYEKLQISLEISSGICKKYRVIFLRPTASGWLTRMCLNWERNYCFSSKVTRKLS